VAIKRRRLSFQLSRFRLKLLRVLKHHDAVSRQREARTGAARQVSHPPLALRQRA
jgi:hypothetical protein